MKLLHSEIDVVPGRKPQKQPLPEGFVGTGIGVLRIPNNTSRQNSYTIRLKCEQPFWQDAWYTLSALPPVGGAENAPPNGKPDQPGPKNQSLTIFIKDGGTRDVLISLFVPEKSECRAGAYKVKVSVETRVVSDDPHQARKERTTEVPVTVIVRPFYQWKVAFSPEERRVGLLRRRTDFELAITNEGNDWLYCELRPPRPQSVLVEVETERVAVPPPDADRESVRAVPVQAVSRQRIIRGSRTPTALPLTVQRIDAPSVPPLPEEAAFGPSSAGLGASVLAVETEETGVPEVPSQVVYCPPIPDTMTGFLEAVVRNAKGLVVTVLGAFLAFQVAVFAYEMYFREITDVQVSRSSVKIGEPFRVRGKNLLGSQILLYDPATKTQVGEPIVPKVEAKSLSPAYVTVTINDPDLDHRRVLVGAQRLGRLTFLNRFLPVVKASTPVLIGEEVVKKGPPSGAVSANIAPGDDLTIGGVNFGSSAGKVLIDGKSAKVTSWTDDSIKVAVPSEKAMGDRFSVAAFTADGTSIPITPSTVAVKIPAADIAPEDEPVLTEDGQLLPPGTDNPSVPTASTEPTVDEVPKPPTGSLPASYELLLTDRRADYASAVSKTRNSKDSGALAVSAFALAELGRIDEAKTTVRKALTAIGDRQTGKDLALCMLALSKIVESVNPDQAEEGYAKADGEVDRAAPGFAFKDLVIARYKADTDSDFEAKTILQEALLKKPSPEEGRAIRSLLKKVGG